MSKFKVGEIVKLRNVTLEKIEEKQMTKFKVGQKVCIGFSIQDIKLYVIGVVKKVYLIEDNYENRYAVVYKNAIGECEDIFPESSLSLLEDKQMTDFKVGDMVECNGIFGKITEVCEENGKRVEVRWEKYVHGLFSNYIHSDFLKKAESQFKVGEKVLVEGVVAREIDEDGEIDIKFGEMCQAFVDPKKVRKLED